MPYLAGKTLIGWGVIRERPWHFAGLFSTHPDAEAKAAAMGASYVVRYGERDEITDRFATYAEGAASMMKGSIFEPAPAGDAADFID